LIHSHISNILLLKVLYIKPPVLTSLNRMKLLRENIGILLKCQELWGLRPLYHWKFGNIVLIATHIINRIPSPVIKSKTTFEMLFHKLWDYQQSKGFWWLAFTSNPMRTTDKFQPQVIPSLFEYPQIQKAYILINILTKQIFVSKRC